MEASLMGGKFGTYHDTGYCVTLLKAFYAVHIYCVGHCAFIHHVSGDVVVVQRVCARRRKQADRAFVQHEQLQRVKQGRYV